MSLHQLPVELLDDIFQRLHPSDLVALSRTNSSIHPVALRLLYRHLSISSESPFCNVGVLIALTNEPELARHVRSFAIRLDSCSTLLNSFYRHLATALSNMTELITLDIFVDPSASWVLQASHNSLFPRLQHLACSFPLDSHVIKFLAKTDALLDLEVDAIATPHSMPNLILPMASLPRLSQFTGSSYAAKAIVPGRPVQSIHLNSGDLTEDDVASLAKSTTHVVILGATTSSLPVPFLQSLTHNMPQLVYLRITTTYNFSEAPDAMFYRDIANALESLSDLNAFELSGMHWGSKPADKEGRVWQSQPLADFGMSDDVSFIGDFHSDFFLAY